MDIDEGGDVPPPPSDRHSGKRWIPCHLELWLVLAYFTKMWPDYLWRGSDRSKYVEVLQAVKRHVTPKTSWND